MNYLRSDPHYYAFQFSKSLEVAAGGGDLRLVKWLFAHFSNCEAAATVVDAAAMNGHLEVLQFLWSYTDEASSRGNRPTKRRKLVSGDGRTLTQRSAEHFCELTGANTVLWDDNVMLTAAEHKHFGVVRWLCQSTHHYDKYGSSYGEIIQHALHDGEYELVELLLPPGRCVLDYADDCPHVEVIEWMLDCGYLHRDAGLAVRAIRGLVESGRLDLMQQIAGMHSPVPQDCKWGWSATWLGTLHKACRLGALPIIQWLVMQPSFNRNYSRSEMVEAAAANGHHAVVQYLCEQKIADFYDGPLKAAIQNGHFKCVEVLIMHFWRAKDRAHFSAIDCAARQGNLEMVKFLHAFNPGEVAGEQELSACEAWWSKPRDLLSEAAASGSLELVKWVNVNYPDEKGEDAIDNAVCSNNLEVVQWLYAHRSEHFARNALRYGIARGNLPMVKWLHSTGLVGFPYATADLAASLGHLHILKWLYANRSERCSTIATKTFTRNGPLKVADWLHTKFPDQISSDLDIVKDTFSDKFEMLLFLDGRCPQCFSPRFVRDTKSYLSTCGMKDELNWLEARFPAVE